MILPSKKVLSLFILMVALVTSIVIAFGKDKGSRPINLAQNLIAGEKISIPENPDWQDELGNLKLQTANLTEPTETIESQTLTDSLSTSLISNYLALKQSDSLDQTSAQKLVDQASSYIGEVAFSGITASKLNIVPDNGRQTVADYGETLGTLIKNGEKSSPKNEFLILKEALDTEDTSKFIELERAIGVYQKMSTDLITMPVPKTFVKAHLDMTNGILAIIAGLTEMKEVFSDPIKSLQGMQWYQEGGNLFLQAAQATSKFIIQNKILYKRGSGGYYLLYGI